ncbi:MAG: IclR family transcriptional regulator [Blastocatellia bacterium]|nr:IclR family transcriptional regulator [Blastocatellia bacterium]MCS7156095.1 IclR family transcriptional regulator [Blastocatellia bacterium]MDW8169268.1 IclR family transcriptional regulator [Acidobacteriota bacterium]
MAAVKTQSVPAVERALTLLEVLAESKRGYTLSELARLLRLPRSSTHCLLLTLERRGYLHRNEQTGRYMFGLKLLGLANKALSRIELRERAAPYLQALMQQTGLTVHLAILDRGEAVLVEKVEPPGLLRLATWIGKRMDIHCTGVGKALLAYLPEEEIERLIRERGLPRHNENTIASPKRLREELARIRAQGYSLDDEEDEVGLRCLGAPIFDHTGRVVASISVAGTIAQITRENMVALAEAVKRTAATISQQLGFAPERSDGTS